MFGGTMFKKISFCFLLILCLGLSLSAQDTSEELPVWECPDDFSDKSLDIFGWFGYDDEGTITGFEEACNVTINYTGYDDEYFMLDTMHLGNPGYDMLIVSGTMVELLHADGLAVPLDTALIPNQENVAEAFLSP